MIAAAAYNTGIGVPIRRVEDERLLTGRGRYTDDISISGTTFAYMARSPHAHALIRGIDKSSALAAPGVLAVLTGGDVVKERLPGLVCATFPRKVVGNGSYWPDQPLLVHDRVRYVGDRVAMVVAE